MRTVRDLEVAFAELADGASSSENTMVSPRRASARRVVRGRRVTAPLAAALATAAVATTVFVAVRGDESSSPQTAATAPAPKLRPPTSPSADGTPDLVLAFDAAPGRGIASVAFTIDRAGQTLRFDPVGVSAACRLDPQCVASKQLGQVTLFYVHPRKDSDEADFDVSKYRVQKSVNVGTSKGFFARPPANSVGQQERLLWQYAPKAWAEAVAPTRPEMLALAESVRPAAEDLDVPVDPTYDKPGEYLNTLSTSGMSGTFEVTSPGARYGYTVSWGSDVAPPANTGSALPAQYVRVNGRVWVIRWVDGALRAELDRRESGSGDSTQPLAVTAYYGRPLSELVGYLGTLNIADRVTDSSDWFPASKALS